MNGENPNLRCHRIFTALTLVTVATMVVWIHVTDNYHDQIEAKIHISVQKKEEMAIPPEDDTPPLNVNSLTPGYNATFLSENKRADPMAPALRAELRRRLDRAKEKKIILVWYAMYDVKEVVTINETDCGNCEVTYDRTKITNSATAAVLFHFHAISARTLPPKVQRNPDQLYIFWDLEPPTSLKATGHSLNLEDTLKFNATMSYRRNADFYQDYQYLLLSDFISQNKLTPEEILKSKTKTSVAIVSDCSFLPGAKTRLRMIKEIKSLGFSLDGYGRCFPGSGPFAGGAQRIDRKTNKFHEEVRKYKFYFSFENSHHCNHYVTEKFVNNALQSLSVPVVWGAMKEDYEAVAPTGSYIFVEDFPNLEKLVEYLNYLDKNDTAYLEYFRWIAMNPHEVPQYGRGRGYCSICRAVHGINIDDMFNSEYDPRNPFRPVFTNGTAPRTVPSIKKWIFGEEIEDCFKP